VCLWEYADFVMGKLCFAALLLTLFFSARVLSQTSSPGTSLPQTSTPVDELTQARQDLSHGRSADAIPILEKLSHANPRQKGVAHDLGIACYRDSKLMEARGAFLQAIQDDPGDQESVQMLGLTLYRMGQPAAAIPYLERVRQWTPNSEADANYVLGLCYLNAQRYDDARKSFAAQYGVSADSGPAYLLFGNMLMNANLPELAGAAARKALQLSPGLPLAHYMLGEVALFKSSVEEALTEFEAERMLNAGYAPVYDRLGDVYIRTEKYQQAQQALMKAISLDTSRTGPFILMGKVLLRRNDPQSAILYLKHADKMDPNNYIAHTLLGQAYRSLGQEEDAQRELDAASKIQAGGELKLESPK
jgi:tetratricopeptide (TPR) repeat protein